MSEEQHLPEYDVIAEQFAEITKFGMGKWCSDCQHWRRMMMRSDEEGIAEAPCDHKQSPYFEAYTRGSVYCSSWKRRENAETQPLAIDWTYIIPICWK